MAKPTESVRAKQAANREPSSVGRRAVRPARRVERVRVV